MVVISSWLQRVLNSGMWISKRWNRASWNQLYLVVGMMTFLYTYPRWGCVDWFGLSVSALCQRHYTWHYVNMMHSSREKRILYIGTSNTCECHILTLTPHSSSSDAALWSFFYGRACSFILRVLFLHFTFRCCKLYLKTLTSLSNSPFSHAHLLCTCCTNVPWISLILDFCSHPWIFVKWPC